MAQNMDQSPYPPPVLAEALLPAFAPCPAFNGACRGVMRWNPSEGHVPRGVRGAIGTIEDVRLVLVCAEPGDPYAAESYAANAAPPEYLRSVCRTNWSHLEHPSDQFAHNIRRILDMAWPNTEFRDQMRKTWITNSVLCSAPVESGKLPGHVEQECINRYLKAQLALFRRARVVALGAKARDRLRRARIEFIPASAAAPPEGNKPKARESWRQAVAGLA